MSVWDQLVGQPEAIAELKDAVTGDAVAQAWLITGPAGSGRSVAARCLAAALECTSETPGCGECEGCRTVIAGTHLDVTQIETSGVEILAGQVKELLEVAQNLPIIGKYRIIIVEDADRIRDDNGNRLLKSIEEPPEHTVWILCAPTPEDLLVTIRSRCRPLRLKAPAAEKVAELLAAEEGVPYEQALTAAQICQSHVGLARAMLRDPSSRERRVELMRLALRSTTTGAAVVAAGELVAEAKRVADQTSAALDSKEKQELLEAYGLEEDQVLPRDVAPQMRALEADQKRRSRRSLADALDRACLDLLSFFRDVLIVNHGAKVQPVNADMAEDIRAWEGSDVGPLVEQVNIARERLLTNVSPQLAMEALLISIHEAKGPDGR